MQNNFDSDTSSVDGAKVAMAVDAIDQAEHMLALDRKGRL